MNQLLLFAVLALVPILLPGPSIVVAIKNSAMYGARPAIRLLGSDLAATLTTGNIVLFAVGPTLNRIPGALTAVKTAGVLYLAAVAAQALRARRARRRHNGGVSQSRGSRDSDNFGPLPTVSSWAESFVAGLLNPKTIVFFSMIAVSDAMSQRPLLLVLLYTAEKGVALALLIIGADYGIRGLGRLSPAQAPPVSAVDTEDCPDPQVVCESRRPWRTALMNPRLPHR